MGVFAVTDLIKESVWFKIIFCLFTIGIVVWNFYHNLFCDCC